MGMAARTAGTEDISIVTESSVGRCGKTESFLRVRIFVGFLHSVYQHLAQCLAHSRCLIMLTLIMNRVLLGQTCFVADHTLPPPSRAEAAGTYQNICSGWWPDP